MSINIELNTGDQLQAVFLNCFLECKLDIDKLLKLCSEYIDNDFEKAIFVHIFSSDHKQKRNFIVCIHPLYRRGGV